MNRSEVIKLAEHIFEQCVAIQTSKGREYSGDDDALSNFKRGGQALGVASTTVLHVYLSKHMDSIATYCMNVQAGNVPKTSEPIEGRIFDAINYLILLHALLIDMGVVEARS